MSETCSLNDKALISLIDMILDKLFGNAREAFDESDFFLKASIQFKLIFTTFCIIVIRINSNLPVFVCSYWLSVDASECVPS